jgi:uncharacterized membrane protein
MPCHVVLGDRFRSGGHQRPEFEPLARGLSVERQSRQRERAVARWLGGGRALPGVDGKSHIVRWNNGTVEDLSAGLGLVNSWGIAVSDDGEVIAGTYNQGSISTAIAWTAATGSLKLTDYLAMYGVSVPANYRLEYAYAISGDGLTFGGLARNLITNQAEGFVATVPAPATFMLLVASAIASTRRRRY